MCLLKSSGDTTFGEKRAGFTGCTVTVFVSIAMFMVGNVGVRVGSEVAADNVGVKVDSVGVGVGSVGVAAGNDGVMVDNVGVMFGND